MGLQPFYGKGPHPLLWAGSLATRENIMSGIPSRQNYGFFYSTRTVYKCGSGARVGHNKI